MQKPQGLKLRRGVWYVHKKVRVGARRVTLRRSTGLREEALTEAAELLEQWVAEARESLRQPPTPPEHTFREAAVEYILAIERKGKDPARAEQDLRLVDTHIGHLPLSHVHQGTMAPFEAAQRGIRRSSTISRAYRTTVAVLNHAARVLRDGNRPWLAYAVPKITAPDWQDRRAPYRLSWREQDALLEALPDHLQCPALFLVATGAREQEAASLRWEHEVLAPGLPRGAVWWIPPQIRKGNARRSAGQQQGRYLVAPAAARRAIEHQRGNGSPWVFPRPLRPQEAQARRMERINNSGWRNACRLAGLPIRVHDLRHTFGARMEAAGVPWEYRKVLLGHTVHDVTAHYSAPGLARLLEEAEKVTRQTALIVLRGAQSAPIAKRQPRKAAAID